MFGGAFSSMIVATIHGKKQIVAQTRSALAGLDPLTGEALWSTPVEAFRGMNILTPIIHEDLVFTATYGGGAFCFRVGHSEDAFFVDTLWRDQDLEGYMSSPLLIGDFVYLFGRDRKVHCVGMETGKRMWSSEQTFGQYWSMVSNENRVLALDEQGMLYLFDASPDAFELLDWRSISDDPTWAHLAVSGEQLFVRSLSGLSAYRWKNADYWTSVP